MKEKKHFENNKDKIDCMSRDYLRGVPESNPKPETRNPKP